MDDVIEEEVIANSNSEMATLSDYDEVDEDIDEPAYVSRSDIAARYNNDFRSVMVASSSAEPLSLVVDKTAMNTESTGSHDRLRALVASRPKTPDDEEDSYFYERPPRNADSAPPSLASI
jgi:hypothetical protein